MKEFQAEGEKTRYCSIEDLDADDRQLAHARSAKPASIAMSAVPSRRALKEGTS